MSTILNSDTIHEYNTFIGVETLHPLINSINLSKIKPLKYARKRYDRQFITREEVNKRMTY